MDNTKQVDKQSYTIKYGQWPKARFQRILRLQNESIDQHKKSDAHAAAHHGRNKPGKYDGACEGRKLIIVDNAVGRKSLT